MNTEEPRKDDEHKKKNGDGSPITVGGGGGKKDKDKDKENGNVDCTFDDDVYKEVAGSPVKGRKKFRNENSEKIRTFKFQRAGKCEDHSDLLPANGKCRIEISCEGENDDVVITGNVFGIDMNPDTYLNEGSGIHRNPNTDSFIFKVNLIDSVTEKTIKEWDFNQEDDCAVCTDFVEPSKSHCPATSPEDE